MKDIVLKVENVSKQYRLGLVGTGTLSHDLNRWWHQIRGKENPYLKIGEANDRSTKGNSDYVWALNDINFEVERGEVLGIIGKNGAGKSTLLKLLSKVTAPTTGSIKYNGKIASLLEVGTGFHPDLTGRENIYLNGAILGMTKKEITAQIDEIIDFSGVERYIDTPVKRYSSGMYVRLAFAVAAHLESDILIVDEVLSVGDAEFQKKCMGKMNDISKGQGRTVLFVSHNLVAVRQLCSRSIWLENGKIHKQGNTSMIVKDYLAQPLKLNSSVNFLNDLTVRRGNGEIRFTDIEINNGDNIIDPQREINVNVTASVKEEINELYFLMSVRGNEIYDPITSTGLVLISNKILNVGKTVQFQFIIKPNTFRTGLFPLYFWLGKKSELAQDNYPYDLVDCLYHFNFESEKNSNELGYDPITPYGYFNMDFSLKEVYVSDTF